MANIKSQIKRNRQNEKRRLANRVFRGQARVAVKNARSAFETNAPESKEALLQAISALDKAVEKGVLHKNNAARRKSRLMKAFAAVEPMQAKAAVEEPKVEAAPVAEPKTRRGARSARAKAAEKVEAPVEKNEPKKTTTTSKAAASKKATKSTTSKTTAKKTTKAAAKKPAASKKTPAKK